MVSVVGAVEATVKIVTGLAWPVVVLVSVILLRRQIGRLMIRLTHLKAPGVEADFAQEAAATNELSEVAVPDAPNTLVPPDATPESERIPGSNLVRYPATTLADLLDEADRHPVGGIVRAWNFVGRVLRIDKERPFIPPAAIPGEMRRQDIADDELLALADRLGHLRNRVVHGQEVPTQDAARDFAEAAWRLATAIAKAQQISALRDAYFEN